MRNDLFELEMSKKFIPACKVQFIIKIHRIVMRNVYDDGIVKVRINVEILIAVS
jgi:hypothetical protein